MNENPWLISGAIIGIVAGIAFAPLLAVPVAVALGVGGGTLATTAIGCGIIATGGATGALIGDNSSSNPNRERDAKQNEHFAPNDEETKALKTKSSTPANTQSQEPKVTWTKDKTLTSTPTQFKFTITNDTKSILQKLLKYQIEGVRKILEDEPERIPTESRFRQVWRSPKEEGEGEEEAKRGIRFRKNELSITIPQRIKLDKIKNFFNEVTIVEEDGSYKIKTSKEVFDKISATDITEFSSKTKDFEQLKLLQKNFETFNLYTLYLYKSENIKSDSENFKRTGEAKKESDDSVEVYSSHPSIPNRQSITNNIHQAKNGHMMGLQYALTATSFIIESTKSTNIKIEELTTFFSYFKGAADLDADAIDDCAKCLAPFFQAPISNTDYDHVNDPNQGKNIIDECCKILYSTKETQAKLEDIKEILENLKIQKNPETSPRPISGKCKFAMQRPVSQTLNN